MDCNFRQTQLEAYLDGELERADARELEAHLDDCAECRAALDRLDALRRELRAAGLRHTAPESLRARIAATPLTAAPGAMAPRRMRDGVWRYAAALLLAFGTGGVSVQMWNSARGADAMLAHDIYASHWRALAATSPVDVVSSDRHTVKPWFAGKVAQSPTVRDFADQGFPLVGGRVDYLGAQRVPVLVYRHGQHLIDVFVLPPGSALSPATNAREAGYALQFVALDGAPAAIVSDMDAHELAAFAQLLSKAPTS